VCGFGLRVSGFGLRMYGFGLRVYGFGLRVYGFGLKGKEPGTEPKAARPVYDPTHTHGASSSIPA
jgi:hypothetical protein